ncbi:TolC family outer membrane protein [Telluria aromaticivorans]|nr:TolC family outer membrane protein [Telluria aromaticivorans]
MSLQGGAASAMDVAEAYRLALAHEPTSLGANQALLAGREMAVQGDALLKPRVNLQAGVSRIHHSQGGELPPQIAGLLASSSSGTSSQVSVQLVQPLYNRAAHAGREQLREQSVLAQVRFDAARQDLALRVAKDYFGVLVAEEAVRVAEAELAAVRRQRDRAQARFDVGQGNITDVREAQARMDAVTTKQVAIQATLDLRREEFRETTGAAPAGLAPLAAKVQPRPPEPAALGPWHARGESRSTLVLAKQSEMEIARSEMGKHHLGSRPTLDLVASYGGKYQSGGLSPLVAPDGDRTGSIGLMLNVPLYAGGAINSRQREAAARLGQAEQELAAARREVRLKVQEGYLAVTTGVSRVAAQEQALVSARSALEATTRGRDVGTRTELDVLDAQQRLYSAELDLVQGRADYLLGRLRLSAAAGELDESSLRALGTWLAL